MDYVILSNNPDIKDSFEKVDFIDKTVEELFIEVRDLVHKGYSLISHPLPASMKIMSSPYRSIVLSKEKEEINNFHVEVIENSILQLKHHIQHHGIDNLNAADYKLLDCRLLESALETSKMMS